METIDRHRPRTLGTSGHMGVNFRPCHHPDGVTKGDGLANGNRLHVSENWETRGSLSYPLPPPAAPSSALRPLVIRSCGHVAHPGLGESQIKSGQVSALRPASPV